MQPIANKMVDRHSFQQLSFRTVFRKISYVVRRRYLVKEKDFTHPVNEAQNVHVD